MEYFRCQTFFWNWICSFEKNWGRQIQNRKKTTNGNIVYSIYRHIPSTAARRWWILFHQTPFRLRYVLYSVCLFLSITAQSREAIYFLFRIALNVFFVLFVCFTNNVFADEYFFWWSFFSFWIYNLFTPLKKKKKNVFYCIFSQLVHWIPSNCMAILHQNQKEKWTNQWVYFHIVSHVVSPAHGAGPTFQCWTERLCCIEDGITDGSTVV